MPPIVRILALSHDTVRYFKFIKFAKEANSIQSFQATLAPANETILIKLNYSFINCINHIITSQVLYKGRLLKNTIVSFINATGSLNNFVLKFLKAIASPALILSSF